MGSSIGPQTVTSGLIYNLDAANSSSITTVNRNLISFSEDLGNAYWLKSNCLILDNTAIAPDGTLTADKIIANAVNAQHLMYTSVNVVSGTTYVWSCYAKASEYNIIQFNRIDIGGVSAAFNLTSGNVSSVSSGTASMVSVGNGWYRCIFVYAPPITLSIPIAFQPIDLTGAAAFVGNNTSGVLAWGLQFEVGTTASNYFSAGASSRPSTQWNNLLDITPLTNSLTSAEVLVVAGGGSGGGNGGGGGGGGGVVYNPAFSVTNSVGYTVTVGAGGTSVNGSATGNQGANSSITGTTSSIIAIGGGGGAGGGSNTNGVAGGSGGGSAGTGTPGAGTANQGTQGGLAGSTYTGGGGGGAGSPGLPGNIFNFAGGGGAGIISTISGTTVAYGGGGGGGTIYNTASGTGGGNIPGTTRASIGVQQVSANQFDATSLGPVISVDFIGIHSSASIMTSSGFLKYTIATSSGNQEVVVSYRKTGITISQSAWTVNTGTLSYTGDISSILFYANDDHDSMFVDADGRGMIARTNVSLMESSNWDKFQGTTEVSLNQPFLNTIFRQPISGATTIITFPLTQSSVTINCTISQYRVNGGSIFTLPSPLTGIGTAAAANSIITISDGVNQFLIYRYSTTNAYLCTVDLSTNTISAVAVTVTSRATSGANATEEDAVGTQLFTVDGTLNWCENTTYYYGGALDWKTNTNPFNISDKLTFTAGTINTQTDLDIWGSIDSTGFLWFADWGHDNGGLFNVGNDSQLGTRPTNIRYVQSFTSPSSSGASITSGGTGGFTGGVAGTGGVANTGGGGGGGGNNNPIDGSNSGAGGSGVVIVRYPLPIRATGGTLTTVGGNVIHTFTSGSSTFLVNNPGPASLQNGLVYTSANSGGLTFDGSTGFVGLGDIADRFTANQVTIISFATINSIVSKPTCVSFNGIFNVFYPGTRINATPTQMYWDSVAGWKTANTANLSTNQIYCFAWTIDRTNLTFYLNGQADGTTTVTNFAPTNPVRLGLGNAGEYHTGNVYNLLIYNRVLTPAEINQNFNSLRGRYGI
jgi:hypothetical protein